MFSAAIVQYKSRFPISIIFVRGYEICHLSSNTFYINASLDHSGNSQIHSIRLFIPEIERHK